MLREPSVLQFRVEAKRPRLSSALSDSRIARLMKNADDDDSRFICDEEERIWKAMQENATKGAVEKSKCQWVVDRGCDCAIDCRRELLA